MKRKLRTGATAKAYLSVSLLRDDRSLRADIEGEIHPDLRGVIHPDLRGNVTGLWGEISGLRGVIDECEITDEERIEGVDISSLIEEI